MEKPIAALELTSKSIKLAVGFVIDGKVHIIYNLTKPIDNCIADGHILDYPKLVHELEQINTISDDSLRLKIKITDCVLVLPPYGLTTMDANRSTTILGDNKVIAITDIYNVFSSYKNVTLEDNISLADAVINTYTIDNGTSFTTPPLNQVSSAVKSYGIIYGLPTRLVNDYRNAVEAAGFRVVRTVIAPFGVGRYIGSKNYNPGDFFICDIGANSTSISLLGGNNVYNCAVFAWGSDKITERIISAFNINASEAEKYKITNGLDFRTFNFNAPICSVTNEDGSVTKHYSEELNEIIKDELNKFVKELNNAVSLMCERQQNSQAIAKLPLFLVGGGSQLNGLVDYIEHKVPNDQIIALVPDTLGARDSSYFNVLGALLVYHQLPNIFEESSNKIKQVTREE